MVMKLATAKFVSQFAQSGLKDLISICNLGMAVDYATYACGECGQKHDVNTNSSNRVFMCRFCGTKNRF